MNHIKHSSKGNFKRHIVPVALLNWIKTHFEVELKLTAFDCFAQISYIFLQLVTVLFHSKFMLAGLCYVNAQYM